MSWLKLSEPSAIVETLDAVDLKELLGVWFCVINWRDLVPSLRTCLPYRRVHSVCHAAVDMGPFAGISENVKVQEYWKALKVHDTSLCTD